MQAPSAVRSASRDSIIRDLRDLQSQFLIRILVDGVSYRSPVNFVDASSSPRHRWFPYKEGFSPNFIASIIDENRLNDDAIIFDPFSGVGSTCLASVLSGRSAIGVEISPLAHFIASTKSIASSRVATSEISRAISDLKMFKAEGMADPPENETVKKYFQRSVFDAILEVKFLASAFSPPTNAFVKLALLSALETTSTHRRAGNGVKRKSSNQQALSLSQARHLVFGEVSARLEQMMQDVELSVVSEEPWLILGSSLETTLIDTLPDVDCVITSPPYPNCFDYSKIYQRELWLGDFFSQSSDQRAFRDASVQSHVHATWKRQSGSNGSRLINESIAPYLENLDLWSERIPQMLRSYFNDLGTCLIGVSRKLRSGGTCNFVVGNAHYGDIPVPTDLLLAEMALGVGFDVERIDVYRKIVPSAQYIRAGSTLEWARESNVVLRRR